MIERMTEEELYNQTPTLQELLEERASTQMIHVPGVFQHDRTELADECKLCVRDFIERNFAERTLRQAGLL